jgi:anti-sigma regulatory factor (Ser/Thr protein kinase)
MHERGLEHEALFYAGEERFLAGTLPFIREAVAAGERVMVAVGGEKIELLRSHLNGEADQVLFADMRELGRNPALIIPAWRDFVAESTVRGQGCRGIGEPIWPGRSEAEVTECQHHEALLNLAFDGPPRWRLLCPYDTSALPREVLNGAEHNHPAVTEDGWRRASGAYRDPLAAGAPFEGALPEPLTEPAEMAFAAPHDVEPLRRFVAEQARAEGVDPESADGLVLAVDEVVTNALRYGLRGGLVRIWGENGRVICEVAGGGTIQDPLVGRIRPALDQLGGRGLWIANHFCDLVQIRSSQAGTIVRCHVARRVPDPTSGAEPAALAGLRR